MSQDIWEIEYETQFNILSGKDQIIGDTVQRKDILLTGEIMESLRDIRTLLNDIHRKKGDEIVRITSIKWLGSSIN